MKGAMDLAKRAFASMTDVEGAGDKPAADKGSSPDPKSAAERRFKSAIESGSGIADAFKSMMDECGYAEESE